MLHQGAALPYSEQMTSPLLSPCEQKPWWWQLLPLGYSQRAGLCKVGIYAWVRLPMRVARPERKAEQKDGDNIRPLKQREK